MVRASRVALVIALMIALVAPTGCGGTSTAKLVETLSTTADSAERTSAATDLAKRRDADATARMVEASAGSAEASAGLVALRDAYIDALAIEAVGTEAAEQLCTCLAKIADDTSVDAIATHIGMSDYGYAPEYAIAALGSTGASHAVEVLARMVAEGPSEAIGSAASALTGMPDVTGPVIAVRSKMETADDYEGRAVALDEVLASQGEAALPQLLKHLAKSDWPIGALARLGAPAAGELADIARGGKKAKLRATKALVLMYSLDEKAASKVVLSDKMVGPVINCRKKSDDDYPDEYSSLCDNVLVAMGKKAVPSLVKLLGKEFWAQDVLARIGKPAVGSVMDKLESGDEDTRFSAADVLVQMQTNDPDLVAPLMQELKDKNLRYIADKYAFYIRLGKDGSEKVLIQALNKHGDSDMCVDYLNCGNEKLESAAEDWADAHGYYVFTTPGFAGGPQWGSGE